jgi:hypothetical protein
VSARELVVLGTSSQATAAVFSGDLVVAEDLVTVAVPARVGQSGSRVGA